MHNQLNLEILHDLAAVEERLYWYAVAGQDVNKVQHEVSMHGLTVKLLHQKDPKHLCIKLRGYRPKEIAFLTYPDHAVLSEAKHMAMGREMIIKHYDEVIFDGLKA